MNIRSENGAGSTHVRPVLSRTRLTIDLLKREGGPFDIGAVVNLGPTQPRGRPPETEDQVFDPGGIAAAPDMGANRFWQLLKVVSSGTLAEVFGDELKAQRRGCAVDEGTGKASPGCVRLAKQPEIFINGWGKLRARVSDGTFDVDLSVTDLRFYMKDQQTIRVKIVENVQRRIKNGVGVILSVGLARAFQAQGDTARRHWLQVNNIHLEDDPTWQAT